MFLEIILYYLLIKMPNARTDYNIEIKLLKSLLIIIKIIITLVSQFLAILSRDSLKVTDREQALISSASETENLDQSKISYCTTCAKKKHVQYQHPFEFRKRSLHNSCSFLAREVEEGSEYGSD